MDAFQLRRSDASAWTARSEYAAARRRAMHSPQSGERARQPRTLSLRRDPGVHFVRTLDARPTLPRTTMPHVLTIGAMRSIVRSGALSTALITALSTALPVTYVLSAQTPRIAVSLASGAPTPMDGRLLLILSTDSVGEPRSQGEAASRGLAMFGADVTGWTRGTTRAIESSAIGTPFSSLRALPPGRYWAQALLNVYETFHLATGHTVSLPPDRGEGQQWATKPGNRYSVPRWIRWDGKSSSTLTLTEIIPEIPKPADTKYVRHERIRSERLSKFWGRDMYLGAHVLLPEGFDSHPDARYPLVVYHGHFPADLGGFRTEPPDASLKPDYSERFRLAGYNRMQQEYAYQFYKDWTAPGFPRVLVIEIQHPTPYYDDSYAVNSAAQGPYGDAIMRELIPYLEQKYRGIGQGYARFTYGGSTGGWEAMASQVLYPDDFNGAWIACPDPIDFRHYTVVNLYADTNAYFIDSRFRRVPRSGLQDWLSRPSSTMQELAQGELTIASKGRSGGQWDIWQATYSPLGTDGYPKPIWDRVTGRIDRSVADYWREHFDLTHIVKRDWATLGPKLTGRLHFYVGTGDNYYLMNAVYSAQETFATLRDPAPDFEFAYGSRAEHCWNGDQTRPNAESRLRYHQMFIPRIMDQIRKHHPANVDTLSWRY
jgi:hypothetical protein